MVRAWRPKEELVVQEVSDGIFVFRFNCKSDFEFVDENGPWHFNNHILILRALDSDASITTDFLYEVSFWVRIYNLPVTQRSDQVVKLVSLRSGVVQKIENESLWSRCIRVRIMLHVDKPLQRGSICEGWGYHTMLGILPL